MKLARILACIFMPFSLLAQAPAPYPITVDSERATVPALEVFQANQVRLRASFKSGSAVNAITTETPFFYWQPFGATNTTVVTASHSIVSSASGIVDFALSPSALNYAPGTYTYQVGLQQSGGPWVIKQGALTIKASAASTGAMPVVFANTNLNWGLINWTGLPAWDYTSNVNVKINGLSNNLQSAISAVDGAQKWSGNAATQAVNFAQNYATNIGGIDFDETPSGAIQPARAQWESSRETVRIGLNANINNDLGQQLMVYAKSIETNTIGKGEVVLVVGASGDNPTIKRASHVSEALSSRTIGLAAENIASNNNGFVVTAGTAYNLNTTNFSQGAAVYLGANGMLQTNLPAAPLHGVFIGTVERVGANNGQIYVHIQNYQELEELSDVNVSGRSANDLIRWNGSVWTNSTETDPLFVAASNSIDTRIAANTTGKVNVSTYAPATQAIWSAINGIVSADNALTNVTASGRITATKTGQQVALTFDASGLATGTPIYSVAGLATGSPVYVESDTIATNRLTNYYTIVAADAKFATGSPIYSVAGLATGSPLYAESDPIFAANSNRITLLEGYTNRAASALSSSVWASADSTTNYASRIAYVSATNALANMFTNYLPLAGNASMIGTLDLDENSITNALRIYGTSGRAIDFDALEIGAPSGFWTFTEQPFIPGYLTTSTWATADSTTNWASRITFNATSNGLNTRITAVETYTNRAASALASSVWANADSTTNYASRLTFNSFTSSYASADATTNYASQITFNATSNALNSSITSLASRAFVYTTNLSAIAGSGLSAVSNQLRVTNIVTSSDINSFTTTNFNWAAQPATQSINANSNSIILAQRVGLLTNQSASVDYPNIMVTSSVGPGGYTNAIGYSRGGGNFSRLWTESDFSPSTYVTISAGNTNYWRITTAPTNSTASGQRGQIATSSSNVFIYGADAAGVGTGRWIRISGDINW